MNFRTGFLSISFFWLLGLIVVPSAHASRPFISSESAVPVERGKSRFEVGFLNENYDGKVDHYAVLGELTYGLINNMHFEVEVPYLFLRLQDGEDQDGLGDVKLKAKVRFVRGREANPLSMAGQVSVKIPSCDENKALNVECTGEPDVELTGIASKEFFPVNVDLNVGWVFVGNPAGQTLDDILKYSLAFDVQTMFDALRVVAELSGDTNRDPDADTPVMSILGGLVYNLTVEFAMDAAVSAGLTKDSPDYGLTFGFSYLF